VIEELGMVVAVHGELAEVESRRRSACGSCEVNGACGTSLLERFFGRRRLLLTVYNPIGARPGDQVVVGIPEQALLTASFAAYMAPLLAMLGGGIAGGMLAGALSPQHGDGLSILGGAVGLASALLWLGRFSRAHADDDRYRAVILRQGVSTGLAVAMPGPFLQDRH
jgi:sigma-E factor negative regulatory protein RseC